MTITTAVVPVAGLATRLRPLSLGVPKGLLPVAGRSVISRIVDELAACGIERVVLVTGGGREGFEAQFAGVARPEIVFVEQPRPLGLGDAILRAAPQLDGPFAVALGDALLGRGERPARVVERLAGAVEAGAAVAVAVEEVALAHTDRYGIVVPSDPPAPADPLGAVAGGGPGAGRAADALGATPFPIAAVVEKPAAHAAPSRLAVAGRYAATPALLDALRQTPPGAGGEVQLADALGALDGVVGVRLAAGEERFDVGNVPGYCAAFVEYALTDPELGSALRDRARTLLDGGR